MKIKSEHYRHLEQCINAKLAELPSDTHEKYIEAGLSEERYRWDVLYACGLSAWISDNLYSYLNDNHIDTALRGIMK